MTRHPPPARGTILHYHCGGTAEYAVILSLGVHDKADFGPMYFALVLKGTATWSAAAGSTYEWPWTGDPDIHRHYHPEQECPFS